jgi:hypothetical protein
LYNIAWVARDGFIDLLPSVAKKLQQKQPDINNLFLCHTQTDKQHLLKVHGIENPIVLAVQIENIRRNAADTEEQLRLFSQKYDTIPLIRCMWSTIFETNLSEQEIKLQTFCHLKFWEDFLINNKIDMLIYERPSILSTCLAWLVCQKLNIECIDFIDLPINTMTITNSWNGDYAKELKDKFESQKINKSDTSYSKAIEYVKAMNEAPQKTTESLYTLNHTLIKTKIPFKKIIELAKNYKYYQGRSQYFVNKAPARASYERFRFFVNYYIYRYFNIFENCPNPAADRYFLFPLHMPGEWSNYSLLGLNYGDQAATVKFIAKCLPPWCKLYVKEHTSMFADRSFSFYRQIKKCPNVILVSPFEDTFKLIKNSIGICTLGSTVGFEAFLMGKPVFLMGDSWYRYLPGIYRTNTPQTLSDYFQKAETLNAATEEQKINAVYAMYNISFDAVRFPQKNCLSDQNLISLAQNLTAYIGTHNRKKPVD